MDLSSFSDDELMQIAVPSVWGGTSSPLADMSDDELRKIAGVSAPVVETPRGASPGMLGKGLVEFENVPLAGSQRTTPSIEAHRGNYLGRATFSETGEAMIVDPETGEPRLADKSQHVVLQDPQDRQWKVFARSAKTDEGPLEGISRILSPGLATGPVSMRAVRGAPTLVQKPLAATPDSEQLHAGYRALRDSPEVTQAIVGPEAASRVVQNIKQKLRADFPKDHPIFDEVSKLERSVDDPVLSMRDADVIRRDWSTNSADYKMPDRLRKAFGKAAKYLDEELETGVSQSDVVSGDISKAQAAMRDARANSRAAFLSDALEGKLADAELAAAGKSGNVLQDKLNSSVRNFLKSGEGRNLPKEQRDALEAFISGTPGENTARWVADQFGGLRGTLGGVLGGGLAGFGVPVAGSIVGFLGGASKAKEAAKLAEIFRQNTPLARQLRGPYEDWFRIAQEAHTTDPARHFSRLLIAARNLSTNLKDADISVSVNDLLKSIQGTVPGRTEDEKQQ